MADKIIESAEMSSELEERVVVDLVIDSGETLPVEVVLEIEIEGKTYALFTPANPVVEILCEDMVDEEAALEELEPELFQGDLKHHIQSALRDIDASIELKGGVFTLTGELSDEVYEQSELIELEGETDSLEYLVIHSVEDGMKRYMIALSTEPEIDPGELTEPGKARSLSDDELARYQQVFEAALVEELDEAEEA
jgi:hypothetical protein